MAQKTATFVNCLLKGVERYFVAVAQKTATFVNGLGKRVEGQFVAMLQFFV